MALTDLYVLDKETGHIHRVGDDRHDSLDVRDGVVFYYNLQNGDGTSLTEEGGYEFVDSEAGMRDSKENKTKNTGPIEMYVARNKWTKELWKEDDGQVVVFDSKEFAYILADHKTEIVALREVED